MGYSFAYNNGSSPSGTTKFAKLQIGGDNREYTTYGNLNWYSSAPYDGKFLIVSDTYSQGWTTEGNATPTFWRSTNNSLDSLKDLVNQLPEVNGVTGFTTPETAINYINSTEKYLISQESDAYNSGEIIMSGLTMNLDSGYSNSYPKSGTTWYNMLGENNSTIQNGIFYSGQSMEFDGSNDYVSFPSSYNATTSGINGYHSVEMWLYAYDIGSGDKGLFRCANGSRGSFLHYNKRGNRFHLGWFYIDTSGSATIQSNTWYQVVFMFDTDDRQKIYVNGTLDVQGSIFSNNQYLVDGKFFNGGTASIQIGFYNTGDRFAGKLPIVRVYNRALSASEVLQNYNATKGRFGL